MATLNERLDANADVVTLECGDCEKRFMVDGSRTHDNCPDCHGSNTDVYR